MNVAASRHLVFDRRKLAVAAMRASIKARQMAGADHLTPINIYDTCEAHNVIVRFNDISMEGMYDRFPKPRIHISALRPLARRNLTCAHELGHHVFSHGSTIDELTDRAHIPDHNDPNEFMANQFAYFLLMPTLGIRSAISTRNLDLSTASAKELFAVSSNFGVGYSTLLNHLRYGLNILPDAAFNRLRRSGPKRIRSEVLGTDTDTPLVLVDGNWSANTIDLETDDFLVLPSSPPSIPKQIEPLGEVADGFAYRAHRVGIGRIVLAGRGSGCFIRVAKRSRVNGRPIGYVGLAKYRHLEDDDDN